jgi:hypothetical protein
MPRPSRRRTVPHPCRRRNPAPSTQHDRSAHPDSPTAQPTISRKRVHSPSKDAGEQNITKRARQSCRTANDSDEVMQSVERETSETRVLNGRQVKMTKIVKTTELEYYDLTED